MINKVWNFIAFKSAGKGARDRPALAPTEVAGSITGYNRIYEGDKVVERKERYGEFVNDFYNLVTDFYEYGWGHSFHFAPRFSGETFRESIARHEHYLALKLGLRAKLKVLDIGSGVGGPMRTIARFSGADVTGLNNNAYQVSRSNILNEENHLGHICHNRHGDFMQMEFKDNTFDAAYSIEAICHSPDHTRTYREVFRVLKEGAYFAFYDWIVTDRFDPENGEHVKVKEAVEKGNGLPELITAREMIAALKRAGFEVVETSDLAAAAHHNGNDVPWYATLLPGWHLSELKHTRLGMMMTHGACTVMEKLRIAPRGTTETHRMLSNAAKCLVTAGQWEIFTPMFFVLVRKPVKK